MLRWALVTLAVLGAAISMVLVQLSAAGGSPGGLAEAVCAPGQTVDCSYVLHSRWANFGPIPSAVLGLAYFAGLAAWFAAVGRPNFAGRRWHLLPLAIVTLGGCGSLALSYVLIFVLPVLCTWCLAAHAVNVPLIVLTYAAWPRRMGVAATVLVTQVDESSPARPDLPSPVSPGSSSPTSSAAPATARIGSTSPVDRVAAPAAAAAPAGVVATSAARAGSPAVLGGSRGQEAGESPYPSNGRALSVLAAGLGVVVLAVLLVSSYNARLYASQIERQYLEAVNDADYIVWRHQQAPAHDIPIDEDDLVVGRAEAANTIIVFSDFECARCAVFDRLLRDLVKRCPDRGRAVFKHYPLSRACNPQVSQAFHYYACEAAWAAEAARMVGTDAQGLAYHEALYRQAARLEERPYVELAEGLGIDRARFVEAMASKEVRQRVERDAVAARTLDVEATPSIFVNGKRLANWRIVTTDGRAAIDWDATLALWQKLLGCVARPHAPANDSQDQSR